MATPFPDLNPSENLWAELKRSPQERTEDPEVLERFFIEEYSQIPCSIQIHYSIIEALVLLRWEKEVAQSTKCTKQ